MKTPTLYVIVNFQGEAWVLKNQEKEKVDINDQLDEGWRSVSETSFGNGFILIRLEKENDGERGFGFGAG